ncbi:sugar ABC transporter substrate-binding protein [Gordonia mangrovi]|nr:substrate-binding domain-containing protein [Gordonia mangrovi]UVF76418.1 substrate-binding domain-containing protein [Gordonia mangrovi]
MRPFGRGRRLASTAIAVGIAVGISGCSSIGSSGDDAQEAGDGQQVQAAAAAQSAVDVARDGSSEGPSTASRPAVPDKRIAIITLSLDESGSVPVEATKAAAEAIGWETTVFNANHDISQVSAMVRRAVTAGYDGIMPVVIDCSYAASSFQEAKAQGVAIVPIDGVDCDDPASPSPGDSAFSADVSTADGGWADFWRQAGVLSAQKVIAESNDQAKVISVLDPEVGVVKAMSEGFNDTIEASQGSEVVETVPFTTPDFASGKLTVMIQTALSRHPEANYIKSPFSSATAQYVVPALSSSRAGVQAVGGEGLPSEIGLIRSGKLLSTTTMPGQWAGWAAIDTFNSVFADQQPQDSGLTWTLVDSSNVPSGDIVAANVDYESAYRTAWGK